MRIFDLEDNELQEEDIDFDEGYLEDDKIFIQHHNAIEFVPPQTHYAVRTFYFMDNSSYTPIDEDDPHIVKEDIYKGYFSYTAVEGEEPKELKGIELYEVIDVASIDSKEAWDEYEDIQRYKEYTETEKAERLAAKKMRAAQDELLATGIDRIAELERIITEYQNILTNYKIVNDTKVSNLDTEVLTLGEENLNNSDTLDDIALVMAEMLGGEGEI